MGWVMEHPLLLGLDMWHTNLTPLNICSHSMLSLDIFFTTHTSPRPVSGRRNASAPARGFSTLVIEGLHHSNDIRIVFTFAEHSYLANEISCNSVALTL